MDNDFLIKKNSELMNNAINNTKEDRRTYAQRDEVALQDLCKILFIRYLECVEQPIDNNVSLEDISKMSADNAAKALYQLWEKVKKEFPSTYNKISLEIKGKEEFLKARVRDIALIDLRYVATDIIGDVFEKLIVDYMTTTQRLGQYFTPKFATKPIVEIVSFLIEQDKSKISSMIDICGGVGGICQEFKKKFSETDIKAIEISQDAALFARTNFLMAGMNPDNVIVDDSLKYPLQPNSYDCAMTNSPWSAIIPETTKQQLPESFIVRKIKKDSEFYFTQRAIQITKEGGYAVLFLPIGFSNTKENIQLRQSILRECELLCSITFPRNSFTNTGIQPIVLILRKKKDPTSIQKEDVFMYEVKSVGMRLNRKDKPIGGPNDIPTMIRAFKEKDPLHMVSIADILNSEETRFDPYYYKCKNIQGKKLGEICTIEKGNTIESKEYLIDFNDEDILYVRDGDLEEGQINTTLNTARVPKTKNDSYIESGQILICARSNGKVAYVDNRFGSGVGKIKATHPPYIFRVTLKKEMLKQYDPRYVALAAKWVYEKHYAKKMGRGSIQPTLTEEDIFNLPIPFCSIAEQKKIANCLIDVEEYRRQSEEKINKAIQIFEQKI